LLGFSAGATAVASAAHQDARVRAIILEAALSSMAAFSRHEAGALAWLKAPISNAVLRRFGTDLEQASVITFVAKLSPRPLLLIHGGSDLHVPIQHARENFAAAGEPKALHIVPGFGHQSFAEAPGYRDLLVGFFDRALLGGGGVQWRDRTDESGARPGQATTYRGTTPAK
jgi:alpha-beta hydrolase superfamily lysophospholipase